MNRSDIFIAHISQYDPMTKQVEIILSYNLRLNQPVRIRTDQGLHSRSELQYRGLRHPALQILINRFEEYVDQVTEAAKRIAEEFNKA